MNFFFFLLNVFSFHEKRDTRLVNGGIKFVSSDADNLIHLTFNASKFSTYQDEIGKIHFSISHISSINPQPYSFDLVKQDPIIFEILFDDYTYVPIDSQGPTDVNIEFNFTSLGGRNRALVFNNGQFIKRDDLEFYGNPTALVLVDDHSSSGYFFIPPFEEYLPPNVSNVIVSILKSPNEPLSEDKYCLYPRDPFKPNGISQYSFEVNGHLEEFILDLSSPLMLSSKILNISGVDSDYKKNRIQLTLSSSAPFSDYELCNITLIYTSESSILTGSELTLNSVISIESERLPKIDFQIIHFINPFLVTSTVNNIGPISSEIQFDQQLSNVAISTDQIVFNDAPNSIIIPHDMVTGIINISAHYEAKTPLEHIQLTLKGDSPPDSDAGGIFKYKIISSQGIILDLAGDLYSYNYKYPNDEKITIELSSPSAFNGEVDNFSLFNQTFNLIGPILYSSSLSHVSSFHIPSIVGFVISIFVIIIIGLVFYLKFHQKNDLSSYEEF